VSKRETRAAQKAARRAENQAAWAAGKTLPRWSQGERPGVSGPRKGAISPAAASGASERAARKEAQRKENQAAWAAGMVLERWRSGRKPGTPGPRTGPGPIPTDAAARRTTRAARRAQNKADWAAAQEAVRQARAAARAAREATAEQERARRRAIDRARAAAWHEDRRLDAELAGSDHDVLWAGDYAATRD
jgi:hypothetical protein